MVKQHKKTLEKGTNMLFRNGGRNVKGKALPVVAWIGLRAPGGSGSQDF
jgi:hypothetical protein